MSDYKPTEEDLNWSIEGFKNRITEKKYLKEIKNEYT